MKGSIQFISLMHNCVCFSVAAIIAIHNISRFSRYDTIQCAFVSRYYCLHHLEALWFSEDVTGVITDKKTFCRILG